MSLDFKTAWNKIQHYLDDIIEFNEIEKLVEELVKQDKINIIDKFSDVYVGNLLSNLLVEFIKKRKQIKIAKLLIKNGININNNDKPLIWYLYGMKSSVFTIIDIEFYKLLIN